MTSFYDWYADLPVASPQVFGDQTDVPESGDWWNATYLLMWGSNVPVTRTPDAHWMAEARYKGQKVVVVSPDYADNTKFADTWLPAQPGTDGALAMAMGHVILKEFFVDRRVPFFVDYVAALHRPAVPGDAGGAGRRRTCRASSSPPPTSATTARARRGRPCCVDGRTGEPGRAQRLAGLPLHRRRRRAGGTSTWATSPRSSRCSTGGEAAEVLLPRFDALDGSGGVLRRGVPVRRVGGQAGHHRVRPDAGPVRRAPRRAARRLAGRLRRRRRALHPGLAGADHLGARPSRWCGSPGRWPRNAEESEGRTMIIMGAGICQWFHGDATYRAVLALLMLTGSMGRNGGGWAHYVGPGEVPPGHRLGDHGDGDRLAAPAAADDRHGVLVHPHRPVALRRLPRRRARPRRWPGASSPACTRSTRSRCPRGWAGCRPTRSSTATRSTSPTRPRRAGQDVAGARRRTQLQRRARCGSRSTTRTPRRTGRAA